MFGQCQAGKGGAKKKKGSMVERVRGALVAEADSLITVLGWQQAYQQRPRATFEVAALDLGGVSG